ncbi:hypothetical protein B0H21DRAFT_883747 [Amylocystis lapponica]|nr:hypothetical protein B0H21DRAFT_883747 [Amylocystis lapponica]
MIINNDVPPVPEKDSSFKPAESDIIVNRVSIDEPPPYDAGQVHMSSEPVAGTSAYPPAALSNPPVPMRSTSAVQTASSRHVNFISLFSRHNLISGTFFVDPMLPATFQRQNSKDDSKPGEPEANAGFKTQHNAIKVEVAVVGPPAPTDLQGQTNKTCGRIVASSEHGSVTVNLFELHESRSVDLDVSSTHGKVVVLLPPIFHGTICLRQKHGSTSFLPALATRMREVRATDGERWIIVDGADPVAVQHQQDNGTDRCIISAVHGKVTIGLSGLDEVPIGWLSKLVSGYL